MLSRLSAQFIDIFQKHTVKYSSYKTLTVALSLLLLLYKIYGTFFISTPAS